MNPIVSIILPTYNRANLIAETLYAIQKQTFTNWECIIIDDGGNDNTSEVILPIIESDKRFKFYIRPKEFQKGPSGCRNFGLDTAKGTLISFFDDDDIPHPQNLEICVSELSDDREIYFCRYQRNVFFDKFHYDFDYSKKYSQFEIDKSHTYQLLTNELQMITTSVMWKMECFNENRFVSKLIYAEEWELFARIISSGFNGISIDKVLFFARKHSDSLTGEFGKNNFLHKKSHVDAITLAVQNLEQKKMLTYFITRYFIVYSYNYKEFKLFDKIIEVLNLSLMRELQWRIFFFSLKIRLPIYRLKDKRKKKKIILKR